MLAGSASLAYRGMPDICQIQKVGSQGKGEEAKHGAGQLKEVMKSHPASAHSRGRGCASL